MKKLFALLSVFCFGAAVVSEASAQAQCPCAITIDKEASCTQNGQRTLAARLREIQIEAGFPAYAYTLNLEPNACFAGWEQNYTNTHNGIVCQIHETYTGQCS